MSSINRTGFLNMSTSCLRFVSGFRCVGKLGWVGSHLHCFQWSHILPRKKHAFKPTPLCNASRQKCWIRVGSPNHLTMTCWKTFLPGFFMLENHCNSPRQGDAPADSAHHKEQSSPCRGALASSCCGLFRFAPKNKPLKEVS